VARGRGVIDEATDKLSKLDAFGYGLA